MGHDHFTLAHGIVFLLVYVFDLTKAVQCCTVHVDSTVEYNVE